MAATSLALIWTAYQPGKLTGKCNGIGGGNEEMVSEIENGGVHTHVRSHDYTWVVG